ncbi:MAG: potassium transporter Kup [Proteobacteria bacterium]|nr:potassium transporter Kup [Pseudomonadota bacterium]
MSYETRVAVNKVPSRHSRLFPVAASGAPESNQQATPVAKFWPLIFGSLGVVFGDIGTSPLYSLREAAKAAQSGGILDQSTVIGVISLILWTLTLIVTVKYVCILLRIDNKGEGGTFALMALGQSISAKTAPLLLCLGIAGASFFYGDAVITPAISVLSAIEGLELVSPSLHWFVLPLSLVCLVGLFVLQARGTARVASLFGPVMVIWFIAIALGGFFRLVEKPDVLAALNPLAGLIFIATHGTTGLTVMGLVFLAVTGAEALYADLGHFGRKPIQISWLWLVAPSLAFNYLGQGALLLADPKAIENPFFRLFPDWAILPMITLAAAATIIASQAVVSGAFSLTRQAVQLGLLPRLHVIHSSHDVEGQIYLPRVNWLLLALVILVVIGFGSSDRLAAAYGVSVTATMILTSVMAWFIIRNLWRWSALRTTALIGPLILVEIAFFGANITKVVDGGWLPLALAGGVSFAIYTWVKGNDVLRRSGDNTPADLDWLARKLIAKPPHRVPGTAVFFTTNVAVAPTSLLHNLKHNRMLHERNIILAIKTEDTPRVSAQDRVEIDRSNDTFIAVTARYGFMQTPSVPQIIESCRKKGLSIEIGATSFFLSRRSLRTTARSELSWFQERLFIALARKAQSATEYLHIPTDRVVEIGAQVSI